MPASDLGTEGNLLWVTADPGPSRNLVETTAREFKLAAQFCAPGELLDVARAGHCDLVGFELDEPNQSLALVRKLHERMPRLIILAASAESSVPIIRGALEAGASDVLSLPLTSQELHKALIKFTQVHVRPVMGPSAAGEVVIFCGARGGLGVTTLAVNLAVRLAALTDLEVALMDLDLQRGDVAAFLNLTPVQSLATIAAARDEIDEIFLRGVLTRHPSRVYVLPAPPEMEEADNIAHDDVDRALRALRTYFRYVVVDTARSITGPIVAALEQADRIFLLTDLCVPGVRAAQRTAELFDRLNLPSDRIELLVTRAVPGPVTLQQATRAIGKEASLVVPADENAACNAMNAGAPLNGTRPGGLAAAVDELAAKMAGHYATPRDRDSGFLQRIFTKRSRT